MPLKLKRGDQVLVITGKEKGKKGKILRFTPEGDRAYVEGVNQMRRYVRKSRKNPQGGQISTEVSIHTSNLMLFNSEGKAVRFRVQIHADGTKARVCPKTGQVL